MKEAAAGGASRMVLAPAAAMKMASLIGLVLVSWALALALGQDGNWDLLNYHAYNPFAWLEGRHEIDFAPAQRQTWHNPLIDLPFYLLARAPLSGVWTSLWLALFTGIGLWLCLRLLDLVSAHPPSLLAKAACLSIAVSGAAAYPTIGTSYHEWTLAAALLAALTLVLAELESAKPRTARFALAGFLAGAAFGLKYTAGYNGIALAVVVAVMAPRGHRLRAVTALAAGGTAGALLTAGHWMWYLHDRTGNPIFPYHNDIFHSPRAASRSHRGDLFFSKGTWQAVRAIGHMAIGGNLFSEGARIRDPRFAVGALLALATLAARLVRRKEPWAPSERRFAALLVYVIAAPILWRLYFARYRFATVPECVIAVALVAAVLRIAGARLRAFLLLAFTAILVFDVERQQPRRVPFSTPFLANQHPELPPGSVVVILDIEPLAYATVGLPREIPVYALNNNLVRPNDCTRYVAEALERISAAPHVWTLQQLEAAKEIERRAGALYGFSPPGECRRVASTLGDAWLCAVKIDKRLACPPQ